MPHKSGKPKSSYPATPGHPKAGPVKPKRVPPAPNYGPSKPYKPSKEYIREQMRKGAV